MSFKGSAESRAVVKAQFHGSEISLESGWIAKQAGGAVIVRQGDTMVMVTVCGAAARPDQDFFPMVVDYQEKFYAAGKIPGGYFKREARPSELEILTCRLIDRPIRPMFPDGYMDEVQIMATVLSYDQKHAPDMLAICGASAALHLSDLPFMGPLAGVRVGRVDGKYVINPTRDELDKSDVDLVVAGTKDAIVMVEGGMKIVPEKDVLDALYFGHKELQTLLQLQEELRKKVGKPKREVVLKEDDPAVVERVKALVGNRYNDAYQLTVKAERRASLEAVGKEVLEKLSSEFPEREKEVKKVLGDLAYETARGVTVRTKKRIDGRDYRTVRPIEIEVNVIPRAHGSALFTRGETQAIVTTTLGTSMDSQRIDSILEARDKNFMLHYNFPPYSTGEVKMVRGTGRREIGHGALALRSLAPVLPSEADFPYVIRIVSDITESNGSSSMASVCGGSLSLMQAGVKTKDAVAGVAMGLIKEGNDIAVLTDILGDEDHYGDMDFKVCGTKDGVTGLQMDIKCSGLTRETMEQALNQAKEARLHILGEMNKILSKPASQLSQYAPQIITIKINPEKIRDVIGPGGKVIRSITESTGVKIDIEDDGTVRVASADNAAAQKALQIIKDITAEAEVGKDYKGVVKKIVDFGAFVEIFPGTEGLLHISQISHDRIRSVDDILTEGDEVNVRVLDVDRSGKIRLSRKELLAEGER